MSFSQSNVLGTSITSAAAPTVAIAGPGSLAITGIAVGWQIHLAFYVITLGLALCAIASSLRGRRVVVVDRNGNEIDERYLPLSALASGSSSLAS